MTIHNPVWYAGTVGFQELHSVSFAPPSRILSSDGIAEAIGASIDDQSLFIRYKSEVGAVTERAVTPLALMRPVDERDYKRPWSMLAWCHEREAVRVFFLTRILAMDPIPRRELTMSAVIQEMADLQPANRRRLQTNPEPKRHYANKRR